MKALTNRLRRLEEGAPEPFDPHAPSHLHRLRWSLEMARFCAPAPGEAWSEEALALLNDLAAEVGINPDAPADDAWAKVEPRAERKCARVPYCFEDRLLALEMEEGRA